MYSVTPARLIDAAKPTKKKIAMMTSGGDSPVESVCTALINWS